MNSSENSALQAINKNFPDLTINSINFVGEGMDSQAFLVNDELIFRFPKHADVSAQLQIEINTLPELQKILDLAIPNFQYMGKQANDYNFVGYPQIVGRSLDKDFFDRLTEDLQEKPIKQLANFLLQVHSFPSDQAISLGVTVDDFQKNFSSDLETIRAQVHPLLDEQAEDYVEEFFQDYLSDKNNFIYTPTLLHADLSPEHIIYDEAQQSIIGIIDFGDIEIGDPDYDLMYLYQDYSPEFVTRLLKYYPHPDSSRLMKKLDFFSRYGTIDDILTAITKGDDKLLAKSLKQLEVDKKARL